MAQRSSLRHVPVDDGRGRGGDKRRSDLIVGVILDTMGDKWIP